MISPNSPGWCSDYCHISKNKITFNDISTILLKIIKMNEFTKFKTIKVKNIDQIVKLNAYVSLKIDNLTI